MPGQEATAAQMVATARIAWGSERVVGGVQDQGRLEVGLFARTGYQGEEAG